MLRTLLTATLLLAPATVAAQSAQPVPDSARLIVEQIVSRDRVPGLAITVSDERSALWREGFGFADIERRTAATPETQFRVGSISKLLTVAALMRFVQEGTLDLDTPIARYDPALPPHLGALTLRQLAGHLGGVRHYRGREFFSTAGCGELREGLDVFASDTLIAPPGSRYAYTSYGYNLIGATMEAVSGRSFAEIVRAQVLKPLGMNATRPDFAADTGDRRRARLYSVSDSAVTTAQQDDLSCRWPSGGYLSSTDDLAALGRSMLGTALLDSASVAEVVTLQETRSGEPAPVGLGWRVSHDSAGRRYLHHGGASNGGRAFLLVYPAERLVVALAGNALADWGEREALAIARIILGGRSAGKRN